jgi:predicted HAD superfamily Cof-like phosphohydrolase
MSTVPEQVLAFHEAMGLPVADRPAIPKDPNLVRLRVKLLMEEAFETLAAVFGSTSTIRMLMEETMTTIERDPLALSDIDLPELADGLGDLDYVTEGLRLSFGIRGEPIADEIHRTNMAKANGPRREDGKLLKPKDWTPPDVRGELEKQIAGHGHLGARKQLDLFTSVDTERQPRMAP